MLTYYFCLLMRPISPIIDYFLRIKRLFWADNSVRILNYHSISSGIKGKRLQHVAVSPEVFSSQMEFLARHRFNIVDLDTLLDWIRNRQPVPPRTLILTFDDGYEDNFTKAFPILNRHSFRAVFSIITNYIDKDSPFPWIRGRLSEKKGDDSEGMPLKRWQLLALSHSGMTIASHTCHHNSLSRMDQEKVTEELSESRKELEEILGAKIRYFTFPYGSWGDFNDRDKKLVQSGGYKAALSTKAGHNTLGSDLYELRRIPVFDMDGVSNFKRKVMGVYDVTGVVQRLGFELRRLTKRRK